MDSRQIASIILRAPKEVARALSDELPRKAAIISKNHFRQNFRESGFVDGGLRPWKRTRRQEAGDDRGPLTSRRNHLMNSIDAVPAPGQVIVTNPVPYAAIHNEGGTVNTHPTVTPKMCKGDELMFFNFGGRQHRFYRKYVYLCIGFSWI